MANGRGGGNGGANHDHPAGPAGAILGTARCSIRNVFFIGPYGHRISFASQQLRAVNLVWALSKHPGWPKKALPEIAIVGGGIAGVMAAAALVMRRCSVRLYEKEPQVLLLQNEAGHRTVHPSVNFWPEERLHPTTALPFFDWYPGTASAILKTLKDEWEIFSGKIANRPGHAEVVDIAWDETENQVRLKLADGCDEYADIVLVASGFGKEENLGDTDQKSYWDEDKIDKLAEQLGQDILVSGAGDGGLIDALRLTYPGFMRNELALTYLEMIDDESISLTVKDIEDTAALETDPDKRAALYAKRYGRLAKSVTTEAQDLFPPLPDRKKPVELVGRFASPFEIGSAPIHKLILAHALNTKAIRFVHGSVSYEKGDYYLAPPGQPKQLLKRDRIIIRHGTENPAIRFLGKNNAADLRRRQEDFGDYLYITTVPAKFFKRDDLYPSKAGLTPAFVEKRLELANEFLPARHSLTVDLAEDSNGRPLFLLRASPIPGGKRPLAKNVMRLFGIALDRRAATSPAELARIPVQTRY